MTIRVSSPLWVQKLIRPLIRSQRWYRTFEARITWRGIALKMFKAPRTIVRNGSVVEVATEEEFIPWYLVGLD